MAVSGIASSAVSVTTTGRAMHRDADAAAHADAVDQRHPGLAERGDATVDRIFLGEEGLDRGGIAGDGLLRAPRRTSPPAQKALPPAPSTITELHCRIIRPGIQRGLEAADHGEVEGVRVFGRFISRVPAAALTAGQDGRLGCFAHAAFPQGDVRNAA